MAFYVNEDTLYPDQNTGHSHHPSSLPRASCCTIGPQCLHPRIPPTTDQKYLKKNSSEFPKKQNLNLPHAQQLFTTICIVFTIIYIAFTLY